jgi:hypothetical protein
LSTVFQRLLAIQGQAENRIFDRASLPDSSVSGGHQLMVEKNRSGYRESCSTRLYVMTSLKFWPLVLTAKRFSRVCRISIENVNLIAIFWRNLFPQARIVRTQILTSHLLPYLGLEKPWLLQHLRWLLSCRVSQEIKKISLFHHCSSTIASFSSTSLC